MVVLLQPYPSNPNPIPHVYLDISKTDPDGLDVKDVEGGATLDDPTSMR